MIHDTEVVAYCTLKFYKLVGEMSKINFKNFMEVDLFHFEHVLKYQPFSFKIEEVIAIPILGCIIF